MNDQYHYHLKRDGLDAAENLLFLDDIEMQLLINRNTISTPCTCTENDYNAKLQGMIKSFGLLRKRALFFLFQSLTFLKIDYGAVK